MCGYEANKFTLKGFRAGRATYLAKCGYPLGRIVQEGGWRGASVHSYLQDEAVEPTRALWAIMESSDAENADDDD